LGVCFPSEMYNFRNAQQYKMGTGWVYDGVMLQTI
jgi:hypothetical protein